MPPSRSWSRQRTWEAAATDLAPRGQVSVLWPKSLPDRQPGRVTPRPPRSSSWPALVCGDEASSHSPCRSGQAPRSPFAVVLSVLRPSPLPPSDSQVLQPHPAWVGKPHPILVSLHHFVRASAFLGIRLDPYLGQLDPPKLRKARRAFHQS